MRSTLHSTPYFYPRSPRGERLHGLTLQQGAPLFLSTLPARGATSWAAVTVWAWAISIHAPREGSDAIHPPLSSCWNKISIHAPREGSDRSRRSSPAPGRISIHAPREGSD